MKEKTISEISEEGSGELVRSVCLKIIGSLPTGVPTGVVLQALATSLCMTARFTGIDKDTLLGAVGDIYQDMEEQEVGNGKITEDNTSAKPN